MTPTELAADRPCCAHLKISYRTEPCNGTNVRGEVVPGGAVRGWWECDSGCGARFAPVLARGVGDVREHRPDEQVGDPVGPAWQRGTIRDADENDRLIEMDCCGFMFHAMHCDDTGGYTCPDCNAVANARTPDVRAWIEGLDDKALARHMGAVERGWYHHREAGVRAALLALCGGKRDNPLPVHCPACGEPHDGADCPYQFEGAEYRGGSEQTQAVLEPSQHQDVSTVAPDCEVISASPATPGEPQDAPPDHEAFKALRTFGNESIKRSRAPTEASVEAAATWAKRARGQAQLAGEYESIIQKARRIIDRFPARLETENGEESLVSWGRRVEDWYVGLRAALGAARTEEREP